MLQACLVVLDLEAKSSKPFWQLGFGVGCCCSCACLPPLSLVRAALPIFYPLQKPAMSTGSEEVESILHSVLAPPVVIDFSDPSYCTKKASKGREETTQPATEAFVVAVSSTSSPWPHFVPSLSFDGL